MTTTINLTPAEAPAWRVVPAGGTFRLVRDGEQWPCPPTTCDLNGNHPPAEFVQACAPCETCANPIAHMLMVGIIGRHDTCPARRIELVGPCPTCLGKTGWHGRDVPRTGAHNADRWFPCGRCRADHYSAPTGAVTLGHAYAVGQPLPIRPWASHVDTPEGEWLACSETTVAKQVCHNGILATFPAITDRLAHYGPPESLVGKWAVELRRA